MIDIENALSAGYSTKKILKYLAKAFPDIGSRINLALSLGNSSESILKQFANMDSGKLKKADKQIKSYDNPYIEAQRLTKESRPVSGILKTAGTLGLAAGGIYGLTRGLPKIANAPMVSSLLKKLGLPSSLLEADNEEKNESRQGSPLALESLRQQSNQLEPKQPLIAPQQPPIDQVSPIVPESDVKTSTTEKISSQSPNQQIAKEFIDYLGLDEKVQNLRRQNASPEEIGKALKYDLTPQQRKVYNSKLMRGEIKPLEHLVRDYLGTAPPASPKPSKPEVGQTVISPEGIEGDIKSIREKEALVDSNGKLHKVKVEDLITSPLPEKDLADLYDDLLKGVEKETEEDVSRMVNFAGYDPNNNSLAFLPHDGGLYIYEDISPEDVKLLTNILNTRKTSGENFIGAWKAGSKSPIGSAMSSLIGKLQQEAGGKGKEYSMKFQTVYNYLEPAIKAKKAKKKKKT